MPHVIFYYIRKESDEAFNAYLYQEKPNLDEIIYKKESNSSSYYGSNSSSHTNEEENIWEGYTPFHMIITLKAKTKWEIFYKYLVEIYIHQFKDEPSRKEAITFIFDKSNIIGHTPFHTYVTLNLHELDYIFEKILSTFGKDIIDFDARTFYEKNSTQAHQNAVHLCVKSHHNIQMLNFLIETLKLDYKLYDADRLLPIHLAASYKNFSAIEKFLDLDSSLLYKTTGDDNTILHILAEKNDVESLKKLRHLTINFQIRNNDSLVPLHYAATTLSYEMVGYLIVECGVRIDLLSCHQHYTPLHCLIESFSKLHEIKDSDTKNLADCFSLFIQYGFDPYEHFASNQSVMIFAKNKLKKEHFKLLHEKADELKPDIDRHRLARGYRNTDVQHFTSEQQQILYLKMKESLLLFAAQTLDHSHQSYLQEVLKQMETRHSTLSLLSPMLFSNQQPSQTIPPDSQHPQTHSQHENRLFKFGH